MHLQAAVADKAEGSAPAAAGKNKGSGPINGTSAAEKRKQVAAAEAAKKTPAAGECYVLMLGLVYCTLSCLVICVKADWLREAVLHIHILLYVSVQAYATYWHSFILVCSAVC